MKTLLIALAGVASLVAAASAMAYVPSTTTKTGTRLRWMGSNCVMLRVNSKGSDDVPGAPAVVAAKRAMNNWLVATQSCSYLRFQALPDSPDAVAGFNKEGPNDNVIVWVERGWVEKGGAHDPSAAALTTVFFIEKENNTADGQILDADVELNGTLFQFSDAAAPGKTDIENTVTHELGHLMGLDHPCDDNASDGKTAKDNLGNPAPYCYPVQRLPATMRETTMFNFADPGETKKRTPEADDIRGICETYPKAKDPGQCGPAIYMGEDRGCEISTGSSLDLSLVLVIVLVIVLVLGVPRLRRGK